MSIYYEFSKIYLKKNKQHRIRLLSSSAVLTVLLVTILTNNPSQAAPTGGTIAKGDAKIVTNGTITTITQTTPRAVINWSGFDIANNENVEFKLPNNGATLNNIAGVTSQILGQVTSNGTLYFVNQNGFVFGPQSNVIAKNIFITPQIIDSGNFISNADHGHYVINSSDNNSSSVVIKGEITLLSHGTLGIFAPHIEISNNAFLLAPKGSVLLLGGAVKSFDFTGDDLIKFELSDSPQAVIVNNAGKIKAEGGQVVLTARGSPHKFNAVVENNGILDTSAGRLDGGSISLTAENGSANLTKSGKIYAGINGIFTYTRNKPRDNIIIDDEFIKQINIQSGLNLNFTASEDIRIYTPLRSGNNGKYNFTAGQGITLLASVNSGGLSMRAIYVRDYSDLTIGRGGIDITSSGVAWHSNEGITFRPSKKGERPLITVKDGGNITFIANNGGHIQISSSLDSHDINLISNNGGIKVDTWFLSHGGKYAKGLTASGNINIEVHGRGNINLQDNIDGKNIYISTENGSIDSIGNMNAGLEDYGETHGTLDIWSKSGYNTIKLGYPLPAGRLVAGQIKIHADKGDIEINVDMSSLVVETKFNHLEIDTMGNVYINKSLRVNENGTLFLHGCIVYTHAPIYREQASSYTMANSYYDNMDYGTCSEPEGYVH